MDWSWVDAIFGGILLLSVIVGLVRGLVYELMSLAGWLVAYVVALWGAPRWASSLPVGQPGSALNVAAALLLTFLAVLIVWGLIARLVRWLVHATPLSLVDRSLGACFGLVRGGVILLCVVTAVSFTPWAKSGQWRSAPSVQWVSEALLHLKPWLPSSLNRFLPSSLNEG